MRPSTTARRYAEAAFQVARDDGDIDAWISGLQGANEVLQRPVVRAYFDDPNAAREEKVDALPRMFPDLRPHVLNLLRILTVRHRTHLVPGILAEFERLVREERGVLEAWVTVARPLSDEEQTEITQRLSDATGKQVEIQSRVDPAIIGGLVVRVGDRLIDASISGRLQRLRQELAL